MTYPVMSLENNQKMKQSEAVWKMILASYKNGKTVRFLAKKYDVCRGAIEKRARGAGIRKRLTPKRWSELVESCKNPKELSFITGVSLEHSRRILERHGFGVRESRQRFIKATGTKVCFRCGFAKSLDCFHNSSKTLDKKDYACKECKSELTSNYRKTKRGLKALRASAKKYQSSERGRSVYRALRKKYNRLPKYKFQESVNRCRRRKLAWEITFEDYVKITSSTCYYCNGRLPEVGTGLDRIDNSLGYTKENVVPCCTLCNITRQDNFTHEEMKSELGPTIKRILSARNGRRLDV